MALLVNVAYPAVRGMLFLALLMLIGGPFAMRFVTRHVVADSAVPRRIERLLDLVAALLLVACVCRGALQVLSFQDPGEPFDRDIAIAAFTAGTWGRSYLLQTSAALLLVATSLLRRSAARNAIGALCIVIAVWAQSGMGHATESLWPEGLGRLNDVLHLAGAGAWVGTLIVLGLTTIPVLRAPPDCSVLFGIVRDFSVAARAGSAIVIATGLLSSWRYLGHLSALWQSGWGRVLLVKLCCFAAVASAGWWNWRVVTPRLACGDALSQMHLRRAVAIELSVTVLLLAVTALLVASALPGR